LVHHRTRHKQGGAKNKETSRGKIQQANGKVKEEVGRITGATPSVARGKTEQVAGKIKEKQGDVKQTPK
jgi:uncharacterized protein YjbJ (UPF0337 family)